MSARYIPDGQNSTAPTVCDLSQLPLELKRVLSVQFREFIHHLEDNQIDNCRELNPRVIQFLETCLADAS